MITGHAQVRLLGSRIGGHVFIADPVLRRIVAQREAEQEAALLRPVERVDCRVCGVRLNLSDDPTRTVCSGCGGRKRQTQLEQEEQRQRWLLGLVGIMSDENTTTGRTCPFPGCGNPLRASNTRGICTSCWKQGRRPTSDPGSYSEPLEPRTPKKAKNDVRKKFRIVADALGEDADALLDDFCASWLMRVASSVKREA